MSKYHGLPLRVSCISESPALSAFLVELGPWMMEAIHDRARAQAPFRAGARSPLQASSPPGRAAPADDGH